MASIKRLREITSKYNNNAMQYHAKAIKNGINKKVEDIIIPPK